MGTASVLDLKQQPNDKYRAFLITRSFKPQSTLVLGLAAPAESESPSETQRAKLLEALAFKARAGSLELRVSWCSTVARKQCQQSAGAQKSNGHVGKALSGPLVQSGPS